MHLITNPEDHFSIDKNNPIPINLVSEKALKAGALKLPKETMVWAKANGFEARTGQHCLIPNLTDGVKRRISPGFVGFGQR